MAFSLDDLNITPQLFCGFIEFLLDHYASLATVKNVISSISTVFSWLGVSQFIFKSQPVKFMIKALDKTVRYFPKKKSGLSLEGLFYLCNAATALGRNAVLFRAFLTLLYFSMLRVSNLLPGYATSFDSSRHLTLSDLKRFQAGYTLRVKWAKNLQNATDSFVLPLLFNADPGICPVRALDNYLGGLGAMNADSPVFFFRDSLGYLRSLTIQTANRFLKYILERSNLATSGVTLHSFRRGSCTAAFEAGSPIQDLKAFGGWRSDAVLIYLSELSARKRVAKNLSRSKSP